MAELDYITHTQIGTGEERWFKDVGAVRSTELIDLIYPVGSYYETSNTSFNPNTYFGGTWVLENQGYVHVSGGSSYPVANANSDSGKGASNGGKKDAIIPSHTHTLTRSTNVAVAAHGITQPTFNTPNHTHGIYLYRDSRGSHEYMGTYTTYGTSTNYTSTNTTAIYGGGGVACSRTTNVALTNNHSVTQPVFTCSTVGESVTNANMQPYINVNRWHRTA